MRWLSLSTLKSSSSEQTSEGLRTRSFSYSVSQTYMPIPTKNLLTPNYHGQEIDLEDGHPDAHQHPVGHRDGSGRGELHGLKTKDKKKAPGITA